MVTRKKSKTEDEEEWTIGDEADPLWIPGLPEKTLREMRRKLKSKRRRRNPKGKRR